MADDFSLFLFLLAASLKESGINRQFRKEEARVGERKCKFPASWKEEKRIRARACVVI